jgi:hypothetical protein
VPVCTRDAIKWLAAPRRKTALRRGIAACARRFNVDKIDAINRQISVKGKLAHWLSKEHVRALTATSCVYATDLIAAAGLVRAGDSFFIPIVKQIVTK